MWNRFLSWNSLISAYWSGNMLMSFSAKERSVAESFNQYTPLRCVQWLATAVTSFIFTGLRSPSRVNVSTPKNVTTTRQLKQAVLTSSQLHLSWLLLPPVSSFSLHIIRIQHWIGNCLLHCLPLTSKLFLKENETPQQNSMNNKIWANKFRPK